MITENDVVNAFRHHLKCEARYMELDGETDFCSETDSQREEREDAMVEFDTLMLQYLSSKVR